MQVLVLSSFYTIINHTFFIPFQSKVTLSFFLVEKMDQRKHKRNIVTIPNRTPNSVSTQAKHALEQIQFLLAQIFLWDKVQILSHTQFNFCKLLKFNSNILFVFSANCSYSFGE